MKNLSALISFLTSSGIYVLMLCCMEFIICMCTHVGTDRPKLKYLNYVKTDIATKWFDIGVALLDAGDEVVLNITKENFPGDAMKCTSEMFKLWLDRKPEASWNDLIRVLKNKNIKLKTLAKKIKTMLSKGTI